MSEQLKYIVGELNNPPFNKKLNLINFDGSSPEQLLQVLTDVLAEIDSSNKVDVRAEDPEQTTIRILNMLRILKYRPQINVSLFRQGLVQGDKQIIHPILDWLFKNMHELKKRIYLAEFLVKVEIPIEILSDVDIAALYEQYEGLIEDFKIVHKDGENIKKNGYSVSELKTDIETMEKEKEIVLKRIDRMQQKVDDLSNKEVMLNSAHALRLEKERERELTSQKEEQTTSLSLADSKTNRLKRQLNDLQQAALGATPEGLLQKIEEETRLNSYIVNEKLPKEIKQRKLELEILEKVSSEPAFGRAELNKINTKIQSVNLEVSQIVDRHLETRGDPADDKLTLFRQQAGIIGRKREQAAEQLANLRSKLTNIERDIQEKHNDLETLDGGNEATILHGEDYKRYLNKLRIKSNNYKRQRADLSNLKAEFGILSRTLDLLKAKEEAVGGQLNLEETKSGVGGFSETKERLELASTQKSELDQTKGQSLEAMSSLVIQLQHEIASKKAQLAPIIKELRPLREQYQQLSTIYNEKKQIHDSTSAGLDSTIGKLEQEVQELRNECFKNDGRKTFLELQMKILQAKKEILAEEIANYVSQSTTKLQNTLRDRLQKEIREQEKAGRQLKEQQKLLKENQSNRSNQKQLWEDVHRIFEAKRISAQQAKSRSGIIHRELGTETLILQ